MKSRVALAGARAELAHKAWHFFVPVSSIGLGFIVGYPDAFLGTPLAVVLGGATSMTICNCYAEEKELQVKVAELEAMEKD